MTNFKRSFRIDETILKTKLNADLIRDIANIRGIDTKFDKHPIMQPIAPMAPPVVT